MLTRARLDRIVRLQRILGPAYLDLIYIDGEPYFRFSAMCLDRTKIQAAIPHVEQALRDEGAKTFVVREHTAKRIKSNESYPKLEILLLAGEHYEQLPTIAVQRFDDPV